MTVVPFPTHVQIQTSTACGAACSICPHPVESPKWSNGLMSDELFERIVGQLRDRPVEYLCPYLMADPMSDRKIFDRIRTLRDALPETHLEVSTTGLYLTPTIADRLLEAPLSEVRISSHGISAEEWATTMPGLKYEKAWPNTMRFIEKWRESRPYELSVVSLRGLWAQQRQVQIEAFWTELEVGMVQWDVISRADEVDLTIFGEPGQHATVRSPDKRDPPYVCRFHRDTHWMHILSDGRVTLCCMDYRHEAIIGSILEQPLEQIWHSKAFEHARAQVRGDAATDDSFICNRCEWNISRAVSADLAEAPVAGGRTAFADSGSRCGTART